MHAPRPLHPLSQDLVMATISRGFTRAQAEYDCPIVADSQGDQPLLLHGVLPAPRRGGGRRPDVPLPGHGRQDRAVGRQALAERVAAADPCPQRGRARPRLLHAQRQRGVRPLPRDDPLDGADVVHPRPHQLRAHLGRRASATSTTRSCSRPTRPRRTRSCRGTTPARSTQPTACGTSAGSRRPARHSRRCSTSIADARAEARPRADRGGPRLPGQARRVPLRVRVAFRRGVRPRRRSVDREPVDPARQHRPLHPDGRQRRSDDPVRARGRAPRGADREDPRAGWPTTRTSSPSSRSCSTAAVRLPADRGPRVLHRPDGRGAVPPVRARRGRTPRSQRGCFDAGRRRVLPVRPRGARRDRERHRLPRARRRPQGRARAGRAGVAARHPRHSAAAAAARRLRRPVHGPPSPACSASRRRPRASRIPT